MTRHFNWKAGILGSLSGGLVFGIMMAMMGMLPMVAGLVGSQSSLVGFAVHIIISFIFGLTFTVFVSFFKGSALIPGLIFGFVLWVLFPFIFMPMMMGMPPFPINMSSMMSLMGHLIYGGMTGAVYGAIQKRTAS
ncbi:DUF6789 family protein [Melghirimyces algeriensis]|uniref:DUF1440 domain-containing protein n=1 Tax=Melghirimyces algeriensis TaxID=910412 RepID=A0A521E4E0_9BACL|nr:DUF6789 family protein [Melghirimyces algeriensis]SMO78241.1 hypothetical protein SAMN06264849_107166 [Melghirimyces algeriensis]